MVFDATNFIQRIDSNVLYKDSLIYQSSKYCKLEFCNTKYPVQRHLIKGECVFDFDGVSKYHMKLIPEYLAETGLKFVAYQTSSSGMHIHFHTNVYGQESRKLLTLRMAKKVEDIFGIRNDILVMGHGIIRAEYSYHPVKGTQKIPIYANVNELDYVNHIPKDLLEQCNVYIEPLSPNAGGVLTTCMKYILGHSFTDGRSRLMFAIVSWFKADGKSNQEIFRLTLDWVRKQPDCHITSTQIWASIYSSNGRVGCSYRHQILEELGVDMTKCVREE